ncbi:magnesium/cobalt transporter CorA [Flavobacterium psychrotrophum]|uniref:magnesium/cobalt transporter CorA n=1 Tax=Flavobacterium psychrotrophum TaxID=2294119 RepID=UPI000E313C8D|nr:magnesium/cobalt transporter CorA [Flavobacterium psychrotrophum]
MKRIEYNKVRKVVPNYFEYNGEHTDEPIEIQLFVFDENGYEEYNKVSLERIVKECTDEKQADDIKWINVHGLHNPDLIKNIGELVQVEPLIIGDILNVHRRTRIEELGDVLFFSIKSVLPEEEQGSIKTEQVSFLLKGNTIISFQEKKSDYFTHIRERIRTGTGIVRKKKNDYLLYLMLDAIMENFFITIERYETRIAKLADMARQNCKENIIEDIEKTKDNLVYLKRAIAPLRDALLSLKSDRDEDEYETIRKTTHTYFARLHQKCLEMLDQTDYDLTSLDSASNFHYAAQSQRMNQIMKTLTIFSVIFMPLTFIVGVYGMNFDNMPELHTEHGYYVVWGIMMVSIIVMVIYFKKKDWF